MDDLLSDDFDVDALLEAQSSNDDESLPELERSLEDILNDAEFDDVLGFSDHARSASKDTSVDEEKKASKSRSDHSIAVGGEPEDEPSESQSEEKHGIGDHFESSSIEQIATDGDRGSAADDLNPTFAGEVSKRNHLATELQPSISPLRSESIGQNAGKLQTQLSESSEGKRIAADSSKHGVRELSGRSSSLPAASISVPQQFGMSKYSIRPGAAVAAAAAASRHSASSYVSAAARRGRSSLQEANSSSSEKIDEAAADNFLVRHSSGTSAEEYGSFVSKDETAVGIDNVDDARSRNGDGNDGGFEFGTDADKESGQGNIEWSDGKEDAKEIADLSDVVENLSALVSEIDKPPQTPKFSDVARESADNGETLPVPENVLRTSSGAVSDDDDSSSGSTDGNPGLMSIPGQGAHDTESPASTGQDARPVVDTNHRQHELTEEASFKKWVGEPQKNDGSETEDSDGSSAGEDRNRELRIDSMHRHAVQQAIEEVEQSEVQAIEEVEQSEMKLASFEKVVVQQVDVKPKHTALQIAEEKERKAASSGLDLEEGAVAQPMRLEGIQRGAPAIGLLQIDSGGALGHALESPALRREHGVPQAIAVHSNYIAIGLSKGGIFVIPSKYSATRTADETDSKPYMLGTPGSEKAVSSMCFNQQGDLLLAGYLNGHLILWDVPKANAIKTVEKEHSCAVVHTLVLGHESPGSRNFRAITSDAKGLTSLHTFTFFPFMRRYYTVNSSVILDGQRTGIVLSVSVLLPEEAPTAVGTSSSTQHGISVPMNLSTMMGVVGGATSSDVGRKFLYDGGAPSVEESGVSLVVFVTHQVALMVRLSRSVDVCARVPRPEGIREGSIPYTVWRRAKVMPGVFVSNSAPPLSRSRVGNSATTSSHNDSDARPTENNQGVEDASVEGATTGGNDGGGTCPSLAVAWDRKVLIYQLPKAELRRVAEWDLANPAVGIAWLEEQMMAVVTSNDHLCLFTNDGVEIERQAFVGEHEGTGTFIYHAHFMNMYGNPERAFHNSLAVRGAALYLLGTNQLWRARLLPWKDRIKALENAGDWMGAFHIAMELYDGRSQGVTGLPKGLEAMREAIMPTLLALLSAYIDEAFAYLSLSLGPKSSSQDMTIAPEPVIKEEVKTKPQDLSPFEVVNGDEIPLPENIAQAKEQYARVGGVAIEFCVHIRKTDVLFENVFSKFEAVGQRGAFLELLEPYILKDMLGGLAPEVMQALVEHYSSRGWLNRVEQCVLHMDIGSLDFNQVVRVCRDHGLYSALIYLFTKGLDDFRSPLEELLAVAQTSLDRRQANAFGYKLLVYLKYCFTGLAFPPGNGLLVPSKMPHLRKDLLGYILSSVETLEQTAIKDPSDKKLYPRLRYLLELDTAACLLVVGTAFPEQGPLGVGKRDWLCPSAEASAADRTLFLQENSSSLPTTEDMSAGLELAQETVDAIVHILLATEKDLNSDANSSLQSDEWPPIEEAGLMLEFVAHFAAGKYANVTDVIMPRILNHLTSPLLEDSQRKDQSIAVSQSSKRQREDLMVALLGAVPQSQWDSGRTLRLAESCGYWQVTALLFTQNGDYAAALDSYLKDASRPQHPFRFISQLLSSRSELAGEKMWSFKDTVLSRLRELVELSTNSTVRIVLKHLGNENQRISKELTPRPKLHFNYLKAVMNIRANKQTISSSKRDNDISGGKQAGLGDQSIEKDESSTFDPIVEDPSVLESEVTLGELLQRSDLEFTDEMAETFVELLCRFEPRSVLKFLETYENYRPDNCLKLCQEYGITDGAAFLLERVGDVAGALSLVLADVPKALQEMDKALSLSCRPIEQDSYETIRSRFMRSIEVTGVFSILGAAVALCQRYTYSTPQESESLWFRLLDRFVEPLHTLKKLKSSKKHYTRKAADGKKQEQVLWRSPSKRIIGNDLACSLLRDALVTYIGDIVNGMIGYVPLPVIMNKILEDHRKHEFGDFKGTILEMLGEYGYERTILGTAKQLIEDDAFENISALKRAFTHAFSPAKWTCAVCERRLDEPGLGTTGAASKISPTNIEKAKGKAPEQSSALAMRRPGIQIFPCGHATHLSCIDGDIGSEKSQPRKRPGCPICFYDRKSLNFNGRKAEQSLLRNGMAEVGSGETNSQDLLHSLNQGSMYRRTHQLLGQSRLQLLKNLEKDGELNDVGIPLKLSLAPSVIRSKRENPPRRGSSGPTHSTKYQSATSSKSKV